MNTIAELVDDLYDGMLRINCKDISEEDADKVDEILNQFSKLAMSGTSYVRDDGTLDFSRYIMSFHNELPYIGISSNGTFCMWRNHYDRNGNMLKAMNFETFIRASLIEDIPVCGFDELFE